jgi:hypothetical protein
MPTKGESPTSVGLSSLFARARVSEDGRVKRSWPWGVFFLMAYVGAAIYFITHSDGSFGGVVLGLLQALVWPVYLIYDLLALVKA